MDKRKIVFFGIGALAGFVIAKFVGREKVEDIVEEVEEISKVEYSSPVDLSGKEVKVIESCHNEAKHPWGPNFSKMTKAKVTVQDRDLKPIECLKNAKLHRKGNDVFVKYKGNMHKAYKWRHQISIHPKGTKYDKPKSKASAKYSSPKPKTKSTKPKTKPSGPDMKIKKYENLKNSLPKIRRHYGRGLREKGLTRDRVLSAAVGLLDKHSFRVGNIQHLKSTGNYGLTTLRKKHLTIKGGNVEINYIGKKGVAQKKLVKYNPLVNVLKEMYNMANNRNDFIFRYYRGSGANRISSGGINRFLNKFDVTAKDFRTYFATNYMKNCTDEAKFVKPLKDCLERVSSHLGNTPAVCKSAYIAPKVFDDYKEKLDKAKEKEKLQKEKAKEKKKKKVKK